MTEIIELGAELARIAYRHDAMVVVESRGDTVTIAARDAADDDICWECGTPLELGVHHVSMFHTPLNPVTGRALMLSFCEMHPSPDSPWRRS